VLDLEIKSMGRQLLRHNVLFFVLVLMSLALYSINLSSNLFHIHYIWSDAGSCIHSARLVAEGKVPWVDFSYNYGCGSLWLSAGWFTCFGYTPLAYLALNVVCTIFVCWGITRLATLMQWPVLVRVFVICCMPFQFGVISHNTAACVESVLLVHYLVEYVNKRYAIALVLATCALFFKPALAFFAGFFLLSSLLLNRQGRTVTEQVKAYYTVIYPSLAVLILYAIIISSVWGLKTLITSFLPFSARTNYYEYNYGFFHEGMAFWFPEKENIWYLLRYYLFSTAGIWIAGTLFLFFQLVKSLLVWWRGSGLTIQHRCILICGLLHLAFLTFLFAGPWAYAYSSYLVVFGVAAGLSILPRFSNRHLMAIMLFMVLGFASSLKSIYLFWDTSRLSAGLHYLFMPESYQRAYESIQKLAANHRLLILHGEGASSLLLKNVEMPPVWMLLRGTMLESEMTAVLQLVDSAEIIVVQEPPAGMLDLQKVNVVAERLKRFDVRKKTDHFIYMSTKPFESELNQIAPR